MKCEIQFSEIFGRRLFTTENIYQGETILELPSIIQSYPDMFSIEASPGVHVDCSSSPAGAIRHSCDPNTAVRNFKIVAWKCIEAGEEITLNYRKTENKLAYPFICQCGICPPGTKIE